MFLLYHAYVYLEFLILACTIYILAPTYAPELNGYVSFMSGKKYGFVGLDRTTGDITTFHIKNIFELIKKAPSLGFER